MSKRCLATDKGNLNGELKSFTIAANDQLTAAAGPEAVRAVRNRAIRDALIGAACAIGGVALTVGGYMEAAQKPGGGEFKVAYGLVLFGLVMLGKGVYSYLQYQQIQRLSA